MRKTLPFTLALLFLAACSTPPTPAPTVDVLPSTTLTILPPTETPTAAATMTVTVTPAEPVTLPETQLFTESYRTGELTAEVGSGLTAQTEIVTDKSGCPVVCRVELNPTWNDAEHAVPRFTWALLHEVGMHTGGAEGKGFDKSVEADVYAKMVTEAMAGTRDWNEVGIGLKQIYLAGSETPQDVTIVPMVGETKLPAGMRAVNKVVWVFGDFEDDKGMRPMSDENAAPEMKALLNGSTLYIKVSAFNRGVDKDVRTQSDRLVKIMSGIAGMLEGKNKSLKLDRLADILRESDKSGWSALTILDINGNQGETERLTNRP